VHMSSWGDRSRTTVGGVGGGGLLTLTCGKGVVSREGVCWRVNADLGGEADTREGGGHGSLLPGGREEGAQRYIPPAR